MEEELEKDFWKHKALEQLNPEEWEALCDGCGKCCLVKLEDEDTGELVFTTIACKLFDLKKCQCSQYPKRHKIVKDCQRLTPKKVRTLKWLPQSCAYRLVADGKELPPWHHLISGNKNTIHKSGQSVKGRVVSELTVKDFEDYTIEGTEL